MLTWSLTVKYIKGKAEKSIVLLKYFGNKNCWEDIAS